MMGAEEQEAPSFIFWCAEPFCAFTAAGKWGDTWQEEDEEVKSTAFWTSSKDLVSLS